MDANPPADLSPDRPFMRYGLVIQFELIDWRQPEPWSPPLPRRYQGWRRKPLY